MGDVAEASGGTFFCSSLTQPDATDSSRSHTRNRIARQLLWIVRGPRTSYPVKRRGESERGHPQPWGAQCGSSGRWLTRAALWVLGVVTLLAVLLFIFRAYLNQVGTKELVQATARLDREDAGWTLDAIELSREKTSPPLEQNSSPLVLKAATPSRRR